jgi:hypothetical protein
MDQSQISSPVTKVAIAWGGVGVSFTISWGDVPAILASIYSALMIGEWIWKHGARTFCERHFGLKPLPAKTPGDRP